MVGKGKSLSEVLIFASTNPQYDDRLFIELQVQCMKPGENIQSNFCTQHVLPHVLQKVELLTKIYLYEKLGRFFALKNVIIMSKIKLIFF